MLQNLKQILKERGMTQRELSQQSGVAIASIGRYCRDVGNPTLKQVEKITHVLKLGAIEVGEAEEVHINDRDCPECGFLAEWTVVADYTTETQICYTCPECRTHFVRIYKFNGTVKDSE